MPAEGLDVEALYAALDSKRIAEGVSWRQVGLAANVSASTFSRLAQGKRPDVDTFAALTHWLGMPADTFLRRPEGEPKNEPEAMAVISSYLRARKELSSASTEALEEIIRAAYNRLKNT